MPKSSVNENAVATARPWSKEWDSRDRMWLLREASGGGNYIAEAQPCHQGDEQLATDLDFIVRAVNSHEQLVVALEAEQLATEFEALTDPRDRIRLLESIGDYDAGWLTTAAALEKLKVRAATMREAALTAAKGAK